jgi:Flp pilus assembly protein TadG
MWSGGHVLRRLLRDESGIALVLTLMTMTVMTISAGTVIVYTTSSQHESSQAKGGDAAYRLAEAGLSNAIATLGNPSGDATLSTTLKNSEATADSKVYSSGTSKWWGTYDATNKQWAVSGKGIVVNPSANTGDLMRTLNVTVPLLASLTGTLNTHAWDYIMSTGTGDPTGCDMNIADGSNTGNPVTVNSRLYVMGNLCLGTNQGGVGNIITGPLVVKGQIKNLQGSSGVGTNGTPVNEIDSVGGCRTGLSGTVHSPCVNGTDRMYATLISSVAPSVTAPAVDWDGWYANAKPGPSSGCTTTNTGATPTFDGNGVRDNSVSTVFNLTPGADYTCVNGPANNPNGVLSWKFSTKTLTISGTIFIDGSMIAGNGVQNQYNGQGTIYLSGTFRMTANTELCGSVNGTNCEFTTWNPNTELMGIVANAQAGQNPATVGIHLMDAQYQGALYATNKIRLEGITRTDGPMIGQEVELGYNCGTNAATSNGFPLVTTVPIGLPGAPNAHAAPGPPVGYSG